jgi:methanogenic corrinoid protein MtbC1
MAQFRSSISSQPSESLDLRAAMNGQYKSSLIDVIELHIIPRLVSSHPTSVSPNRQKLGLEFPADPTKVAAFAQICIDEPAKTASQHIEQLVRQGYSIEDLFLRLIAPVARHLGGMWDQDEADFSEVGLGFIRLQQIAHELIYFSHSRPLSSNHVRRMMLGSAPGSQHLLGPSIVAELFRTDGWQVVVEIADSQSALIHTVGNEWFDLIGLSVGLSEQLPLIPDLVEKLKLASKNSEVQVILGGTAFVGSDIQCSEFGADAISLDAADAVVQGNLLVVPQTICHHG